MEMRIDNYNVNAPNPPDLDVIDFGDETCGVWDFAVRYFHSKGVSVRSQGSVIIPGSFKSNYEPIRNDG